MALGKGLIGFRHFGVQEFRACGGGLRIGFGVECSSKEFDFLRAEA